MNASEEGGSFGRPRSESREGRANGGVNVEGVKRYEGEDERTRGVEHLAAYMAPDTMAGH